ncbi:MAG: PfkB family carbohydrate kinase, partial [Planctomycetota bacterium]
AGDATLGAFLLQRSRGRDRAECLRMAAAAGAATAMTPGVELCHEADVEKLMPGVEVREV